MKHFRLASVLALVTISTAASYGMELFLGLFIDMGLAQVGRNLGVFSLTVLAVEAAGALALWLILAPLSRATEARAEGREPSTEALGLARACVEKVPVLLGALVALGFLIGPFVVMGVNSALGRASYGLTKGSFIVLFNLAIGITAGFQVVLVIEGILYRPIASLGLSSLPQARRKRGPVLGRRIVLAGLASTALAGVSLATAGYGALSIESTGAAGLSAYLLKTGILLVFILAWVLLVFLTLSRSLSRRLGEVAGQVDLISSGKEGSGRRIHLVFDDEVGRLAASLNAFFDGLGTLLGQVGNLSGRVREGAEALATSASHAGGAVGELEASLGLVRGAVERQSEIVGQAEGEIERMVEYIDTVAARVSDQAGFVDESSAAVSQMAANIESVSRTAGLAADLSHRLSAASSEGGEALKASLAAIREIEESSRSVKEIIGVISRIASQTNLLAMNAAIEAAHAGAAGAGFAVVADEVRTLAESSSRSAKEIVGLIQGMGKRIETGAQLSDRAGEAFGRISQGVGETGELVQTIAAAMGEQSLGAQEILRSVDSLTEASRVIKDLTGDLKAESKAMTEAMLRIVSASNEIFESVQEETGSIQSLGRIVALVSEEAGKNKDHVEGMEGAVALFRTAK